MARAEFDWSDPDRPRTEFFPDPETRFRTAEAIIEDELAMVLRKDCVATGAPPPTHQGPDGPGGGMRVVAWASAAIVLVVLGVLAWLTISTGVVRL